MNQLGSGDIIKFEDYSAAKLKTEIADLIVQFINPKPDVKELIIAVRFVKRQGRKKAFKRQMHASNSVYDGLGIKRAEKIPNFYP